MSQPGPLTPIERRIQPPTPQLLLATTRRQILLHSLEELETGLSNGYTIHSGAVGRLYQKRSRFSMRPIKDHAEFAQGLKELGLDECHREWLKIQKEVEHSFREQLPEVDQAIDNEIQHFDSFRERTEKKIGHLKSEIEELRAEIEGLELITKDDDSEHEPKGEQEET